MFVGTVSRLYLLGLFHILNDPSKLSHYSGFVKGMRATGLAAAFGVDTLENRSVGTNDEDFGVSKSPASRADLLE